METATAEPCVMPRLDTEPEARPLVELPTHPMAIIARAVEMGVDADNLAKLMDLQTKWEDRRAAEAFAVAMAGFRKECPRISKTKSVFSRDGKLLYSYAPYEEIKRITGPIEAAWGIVTSYSIEETDTTPPKLRATLFIQVGSHVVTRTYTAPISKGIITSQTQDYTGALTTIKRVLYCAGLDIVVTDEDTDAPDLSEVIGKEKVAEIKELIKSRGVNLQKFYSLCSETAKVEIKAVEEIPLSIADRVVHSLRTKPVVKGGKA